MHLIGRSGTATVGGAVAMVFVGSSVSVSAVFVDGPLWTAQAVRYALACLALVILCRWTGRTIRAPRGADWFWLVGITATGLVLFNVALVNGSRHAEPAVLGVAVACVPVVLAVLGPLLEGGRPHRTAILAAVVVTGGAALVEGFGHSDLLGLGWAVVVFACEAAFTLFAVPLLRRHDAFGISVHTTWLAAVMFGLLGLNLDGPLAVTTLTGAQVLAVGHLAIAVTAIAFVLWYSTVARIGVARAGLLTGITPIAAALTGVALGRPVPGPIVWVGVAVVTAGLAVGLLADRLPSRPQPTPVGDLVPDPS